MIGVGAYRTDIIGHDAVQQRLRPSVAVGAIDGQRLLRRFQRNHLVEMAHIGVKMIGNVERDLVPFRGPDDHCGVRKMLAKRLGRFLGRVSLFLLAHESELARVAAQQG